MEKTIFTIIGEFILSNQKKEKIRTYLIQAGYRKIPYKKVTMLFLFTLFSSIAWYIFFISKTGITPFTSIIGIIVAPIFIIIIEVGMIIFTYFAIKIYINAKIFNRIQNIEKNLPLFLREFSTNLKAGREFLDALEDTLSPEIGLLNEDLTEMVIEIRAGKMTDGVIRGYIGRYDSYAINETFGIIIDSYSEGGGLAELLDNIAYNLETIFFLKKNAIASVYNYIIFMSIVSLLITPILFALSYNVLVLIQSLLTRLVISGSTYLPSYISTLDIDFNQFAIFSRFAI